jgi:hypothetical protein
VPARAEAASADDRAGWGAEAESGHEKEQAEEEEEEGEGEEEGYDAPLPFSAIPPLHGYRWVPLS